MFMVQSTLGIKAHGWEQSWQVSRAGRTPVRLDVRSTVPRDTAPNCVGPQITVHLLIWDAAFHVV